ncbi:3'-5' exonuclease [Chondrinema litorale]|uniref:3'-5' exonuclease n=1 Tax=Chondrinema litorale TaxID=2994555 RepID=UPI002542F636|nr:3'-5' exonuclease [Chondrinema litorale]UZR95915.1 3'-5' exonuclease [Chondrinema litorale]
MKFFFTHSRRKQRFSKLENYLNNFQQNSYIKNYIVSNRNYQISNQAEFNSFVIFDTESTGLNPKSDSLLSIGAVKVINGKILPKESIDLYFNDEIDNTNSPVHIHQIRKADLKNNGIPLKDGLEEFLRFIGNSVLVAHHAKFDCELINKYLDQLFGLYLLNPVLDTRKIAIRLDRKGMHTDSVSEKNYSLDQLCKTFNITPVSRHNALGDAFTTAILFLKILKKLEIRDIKLNKLLI